MTSKEKKIRWIKAAGIRALKTMAQSALAAAGSTLAWDQINWIAVGTTAVTAGLLSLLTSLAGLPEVDALTQEKGATS